MSKKDKLFEVSGFALPGNDEIKLRRDARGATMRLVARHGDPKAQMEEIKS